MSDYDTVDSRQILKRIILGVLIIVVAILAGILFARLTTRPQLPDSASIPKSPGGSPGRESEGEDFVDPDALPIFFYAGITPAADRALSLGQIQLSAAEGLHQYIIPLSAPWTDDDLAGCLRVLDEVSVADPAASYLLQVDLNPPAAWLERNPAEQVQLQGERAPFCSPASIIWQEAAKDALSRLLKGIGDSPHLSRLIGIVPAAMFSGQWRLAGPGYDTSAANQAGFRSWLRGIYATEDVLQAAWGKMADFTTAVIPSQPPADKLTEIFLQLPAQQEVVDFQNYVSESTADAIAGLTAHIKEVAPRPLKVVAPYGFSMELPHNEAGHFALAILTGSDVDGFISPVSYEDRGMGGTGGFMGPVNSAHYRGKQWYIVDDTRTGVARDALTGAVSRLKGLRPEDVYSVQQRNFSAAVVHDLGLVWSDPAGEGWLHDEAQWEQLRHLAEVYAKVRERHREEAGTKPEGQEVVQPKAEAAPGDSLPAAPESAPAPESAAPRAGASSEAEKNGAGDSEAPADGGEAVTPNEEQVTPPQAPPVAYDTGMVVVVDEVSRFYQQCGKPLNDVLLHQNRDAAMRSGVPTQFSLLQDVLEGVSPPAPVYLFLNTFYLPADQRQVLHERLAREQACAIWMYAPGYVDEHAAVENISATTGMNVVAFKTAEDAASQFSLQGWWIKPEDAIGVSMVMQPLFYVEDPDADILANYTASKKASIAVKYSEQGWTSVFAATPFLSAPLLREILRILEQPMVFRPSSINLFDTTHVSGDLIAVHANQVGERTMELDRPYDVQDLLDPSIGWPNRDSFMMPLETGDSRLLELREPQQQGAAPTP